MTKTINTNWLKNLLSLVLIIFFAAACSSGNHNSEAETSEVVEVLPVVEEDIWVIDEYQINDIAVNSLAEAAVEEEEEVEVTEEELDNEILSEEENEMAMEDEYEIITMQDIHYAMAEQEYEALENTVIVTSIAIPLDETQTVVSYGKKGDEQATLQVISSPQDDEVQQIVFTDKKHKDVYDVQAGMSGKQVKQLRKEMKHMVKKGQVFVYTEDSNILYLMDAQNLMGDEITEGDIENMSVSAIIWKDKKHHKKD